MAKAKGIRVVIAGPRDWNDYESVVKAIELSGFKITEVVSGAATGVDSMGEKYAEENGIPIKQFKPDWKDLTAPGAIIKKNKFGPYNANAGFARNAEMAEYADALISIDVGTPGTGDMIKQMEKAKKPVFRFDPRDNLEDEDADYVF